MNSGLPSPCLSGILGELYSVVSVEEFPNRIRFARRGSGYSGGCVSRINMLLCLPVLGYLDFLTSFKQAICLVIVLPLFFQMFCAFSRGRQSLLILRVFLVSWLRHLPMGNRHHDQSGAVFEPSLNFRCLELRDSSHGSCKSNQ